MGILKRIKKSFRERKRKSNIEGRIQSEAKRIYESEYIKERRKQATLNAKKMARERAKIGKKGKGSVGGLLQGLGNLSQRSSGYWESQVKGKKGKNSLF